MYFRTVFLVILLSAGCISLNVLFEYLLKGTNPDKNKGQNETYHFSDSSSGGFTQHKQPHIVFILADDLGYNDVSYNGKLHGSAISTPNIDRLAAEGVTLDNYYVQPICTPTRAQLMTGRYSIRYGLQHGAIQTQQPMCLPLDEVTLATRLKEVGYATHAVGKWHLGFYKKECLPTRRGFDTFFGRYAGEGDHYNHTPLNAEVLAYDFNRDSGHTFKTVWREKGKYSTSVFTREAQRVIRRHTKSKQPLFLYLPFLAPHSPYQVPEHYKEPYEHLITDDDRQTLAGMMSCLDEGIGNITSTLKDAGLYDNTIVIFSSDNGAVPPVGNNWPLRGGKLTPWEGGVHGVGFIHSPLLPNKVRGTTSQALIDVSDWFPTIVSLAGGSLNGKKPLDGYNVWNSIVANAPSPRTELLHVIDPLPPNDNSSYFGRAALRMGNWKLIAGNYGR